MANTAPLLPTDRQIKHVQPSFEKCWWHFYRLEASGDELLICIFCYRWRSSSITYQLTAGELPPRSVFLRGCFSFTPPVGSVKWTKMAWACLIKHPEFLFTRPMAECSSCVGRVDSCFVLCRTPSSFGSTTIINRTSYCVDSFVANCLYFHIRELFC